MRHHQKFRIRLRYCLRVHLCCRDRSRALMQTPMSQSKPRHTNVAEVEGPPTRRCREQAHAWTTFPIQDVHSLHESDHRRRRLTGHCLRSRHHVISYHMIVCWTTLRGSLLIESQEHHRTIDALLIVDTPHSLAHTQSISTTLARLPGLYKNGVSGVNRRHKQHNGRLTRRLQ